MKISGAAGRAGRPLGHRLADGGYCWTVVPVEAVVAGRAVDEPARRRTGPVSDDAAGGRTRRLRQGRRPVRSVTRSTRRRSASAPSAGSTITLALAFEGSRTLSASLSSAAAAARVPRPRAAAGRLRGGPRRPRRQDERAGLTARGEPFASGLSSSGKLISASADALSTAAPSSRGRPRSARVYQVQWSKTTYPFVPEPIRERRAHGTLTPARPPCCRSRPAPGTTASAASTTRCRPAPADVVVGPGEDRRREAEIQDRRGGK